MQSHEGRHCPNSIDPAWAKSILLEHGNPEFYSPLFVRNLSSTSLCVIMSNYASWQFGLFLPRGGNEFPPPHNPFFTNQLLI
jgi:hypothetical protein